MKRHFSQLILPALALAAAGGFALLQSVPKAEAAWGQRSELVTNEYPVNGSFSAISVTEYNADVKLRVSRDGSVRVVSREDPEVTHSVEVNNGTLTITRPEMSLKEQGRHYGEDGPELILYLPAGSYGSLSVTTVSGDVESAAQLGFASASFKTVSGDVELDGSVTGDIVCETVSGDIELGSPSAGAVRATSTSGDIELNGLYAQSLALETVSGDISLERTSAAGELSAATVSGEIELEAADAATLSLSTTSGDIEASLLSAKSFSASGPSSRMRLPASTPSAGSCTISTVSGSVEVVIR